MHLGISDVLFFTAYHREHGHRVERGGRKYVDLDEALLAVVPLWEAEVGRRLTNKEVGT